MTKFSEFIDQAKSDYERFEEELKASERKLKHAGDKADDWTREQAAKLKTELHDARQKMTELAERMDREGEEAVADAHEQARRHWNALQAAVATYRNHLAQSALD